MKKLIVVIALILFAGIAFGQKIKKGKTVGVHSLTFELNPDVTMEEAQDFIINTYIPVREKHHPGIKSFFAKGLRGENKDSYGWVNVVESLETLRKYYNDDGSQTELEKSIREKMKSEYDEFNRIFKNMNDKYTTWLIL